MTQKKFRISVDGRGYNVVVEEILGDFAQAQPQPHGAPEAVVSPPPAAPVAAAPPLPVAPPIVAGLGDEVAPLAGVIDSIEVQIGQSIAAGDKIVTIEAMKMKTEVFAKHSGTVTAIAAKPFQSVDGGQVLLTVG